MNRQIKITASIVTLSLLIPVVAFAQWTPAPASPPSSNVAAPINVSSSNQAKSGGLQVGSLLTDGGAVISGNLGVGLSPAYKLDVNGDANALRLCIGGDCRNAWPSGGSSITINTSGGLTGGAVNASTFNLAVDNTLIQARITGTCAGSQFIQSINQNGTVGCGSAGSGTVTSVSAGSNISVTGTAVAPIVNVVSSPTFSNVTASAYYYSSDRNLKKNIMSLDSNVSLQNILSLQGVSFDWKSTGAHSTGLIAQDVENVYPELVATDPKTGLKSVEYGNLVAPLIEAVKAQQKEIDSLKAEVAALKAK